ncbi:MAG: HDOD domain-containing protein [Rhodocyclaceae bacterium]|nr:HDOD domain-containing protein [Rhodocyclaceae bacterium]
MTLDTHPHDGLNAWLERIRDQELPIFGRTAEQIRALTDSDKAAVSQLADAILCDPGMTAKLLRIGNSVIFNTSGAQITTVSRAVVMIGFNQVRQVALSVAFVDALLRGPVRERVLREMARACHAAVQARWLAARRHDNQPEEVFIAALLYRLGRWRSGALPARSATSFEEALRRNPQIPGRCRAIPARFPPASDHGSPGARLAHQPAAAKRPQGRFTESARANMAVVLAFRLAEGSEGGWKQGRARALPEGSGGLSAAAGRGSSPKRVMKNAIEAAIHRRLLWRRGCRALPSPIASAIMRNAPV